jgi:integrase
VVDPQLLPHRLGPRRTASHTDFTLYDLRHTFASRLLAAGVPAPEVSAWMGHSLRAGGTLINPTTQHYTHPTGDHTTKALQTLAQLMRIAPSQQLTHSLDEPHDLTKPRRERS